MEPGSRGTGEPGRLGAFARVAVVLGAVLFAGGCSASSDAPVSVTPKQPPSSLAGRVAELAGRPALDYAAADAWGCSPNSDEEMCDGGFHVVSQVTDGTKTEFDLAPEPDAPVDCFYVYPTVDWEMETGNHDDMRDNLIPRGVIGLQAAPFSSVCRVFAPFYRQAKLGTYGGLHDEAMTVFLRAFADVAAAFEYYLEHWNNGRPIVIMGHSQGAQMTTYLLHGYFDGATEVTQIEGSRNTRELRKRLVAAFPIGFNVFTPSGESVGGSFSDLPLCEDPDQRGCVIAYRTFAERHEFGGVSSVGTEIDAAMTDLGLLYRTKESEDVIACVNPATGPALSPEQATDSTGQPVAAGAIKLLLGTWSHDTPFEDVDLLPGRYTATCRENFFAGGYLAIGRHVPAAGVDVRGDPLGVTESGNDGIVGLHGSDFAFPMGDLIEQVRRRQAAFTPRNR